MLRDILRGEDAQLIAIAAIIDHIDPDILVLTDIDWDAGSAALTAFNDSLAAPYPHFFSAQPNAGFDSGMDLDGNGRLAEARDGWGYGRFSGDGGMAVLSRWPIDTSTVQDFSTMLWSDLSGATAPMASDGTPFPSAEVWKAQRLSSTGHWALPIETDIGTLSLLIWSATPPVFDGPEDANGLRNRDELRLWEQVLDGTLGDPLTGSPILIGNANLDPSDGQGLRESMARVLADPRLTDPTPRSEGAMQAADPGHSGNPALDTAGWEGPVPGNLRVSYVLPSAQLTVTEAGTFWPAPDDPLAPLLGDDGLLAGPHRLVWVDLAR